jgi:glycosyltransferase involved in cell wall biosynthesis
MTHHGPDYDATKWRWFGRAVLQIGEGLGVRSANAVICVSNYIRDLIRRKYRVDAHTIYNGLPNSQSIEPPRDRHLRSLETRRYVLMVGRLTPHKRIEDVIAAMTDRDLADVELVVCGSGSEQDLYVQHLRNLARQQRNVKLLGFVSPEDLPWVYANALCTVMASSYEGMPLAVLEALSFGSPTLLSRIPAHEELKLPAVQYFDLGNVEGIRACIRRVREQPPDTRSMAATTIDDRFDWDTIAAQTQSVFLRTIKSATSDKKAVH